MQNSSAIHDSYVGTTPLQRKAASDHLARLRRFHSAAVAADPLPPTAALIAPIEAEPVALPPIQPLTEALPPIPNSEMQKALDMIPPCVAPLMVETIQRAVLAKYSYLKMVDLKSPRREVKVVRPRQIAMYLSKTLTPKSLPEIGRCFGGRDHTTVLHSVRKITALMEKDPVLAAEVEQFRTALGAD